MSAPRAAVIMIGPVVATAGISAHGFTGPRQWAGPSTVPSAAAVPGRSSSTTAAREWTGMRPPGGSDCSPERLVSRSLGHILICARKNLDRHPNYILAAYMASGT
jgi:hypothetical protein